FFFFKSPPPHCLIHSFPTRRSSDLQFGEHFFPFEIARIRSAHERRSSFDLACKQELWGRTQSLRTISRQLCSNFPFLFCSCETVDRKSTRLNSSHVAISYAVFCLKK